MCKDHIVLAITALINNCIGQGIFSDKLKIASVIPLHKGGDINDPHNYRPISILPTLSKVFEKHIADQIHSYFLKTDVIHTSQSGFRRKHSCQTALLKLINNWMNDIDSCNIIGSVFLDFRKAFDLVDHEILLHKFSLYRFSTNTIQIFRSYLSNRQQ